MQKLFFLSAQPDDYFFVWQLELQLFNFSRLGIPPEQIHVLIGYDPERGLRHYFVELIEKYKHKACFFPYPDKRQHQKYASSIRPHIIQQHFQKNRQLEEAAIFYHDSDIVFRELPDFKTLLQDDLVYVSDTRSYLDTRYILKNANDAVFSQMCNQVGVVPGKVLENDENCGGAQYLLKRIDAPFWRKVEIDSEAIFNILTEENLRGADRFLGEGKNFFDYNGIQSWCADMWACFYNLLYYNEKEIKISSELDFAWASDPIDNWNRKKILHYTGAGGKPGGAFDKTKYRYYSPFYDREGLKQIDPNSASYPLIQMIEEFNMDQAKNKIDLIDVTFLIPTRSDDPSRLKNLQIVTSFLDKFFNTNIVILEVKNKHNISADIFPPICKHYFVQKDNIFLSEEELKRYLLEEIKTPMMAVYGDNVVIPIQQILSSTMLLRAGEAHAVLPYDSQLVTVDILFKMLFEKLIDPELFLFNMEKHSIITDRVDASTIFILRDTFFSIEMGEVCKLFEPNGNELLNRPGRLEYNTRQIDGPLFYLSTEQNGDLS